MFKQTQTCTHLSKSSESVLIGEEWRVVANLEVKVNRLVCEGGKFIAEAELVGAIFSCCEGKAVILFLHLLVECSAIWILQTTVHIIMAASHHLNNHNNINLFSNIITQSFIYTSYYAFCQKIKKRSDRQQKGTLSTLHLYNLMQFITAARP